MTGLNKEAAGWILVLLLAVCCTTVVSQEPASFESADNAEYVVELGRTVKLDCTIKNTAGRNVNWWFLTQNFQISNGIIIQASDERYSVEHPPSRSGTYILQIANVKQSDAGKYKCTLEGSPDLVQISTLTVDGAPMVPVGGRYPPVNFTDCCVDQGVSEACLPACHPSSINLDTFNADVVCAADLTKLVTCGTDGRNHAPCCHRRSVPTQCLGFCVNDFPPLDNNLVICLSYITEIVECMEEGQNVLPSTPTEVQARSISGTQIEVSWPNPDENGSRVRGYRVLYKEDTAAMYQTSPSLERTFKFLIKGLKPLTKYNLHVIAYNDHGSSLPSYTLEIYTVSSDGYPPGVTEDNFKECCKTRKVREECQQYLCGDTPEENFEFDQKTMFSCYSEANKVQQCLQREHNHTGCCVAREVPQDCLKMCGGNILGLTVDNVYCLAMMPIITLCLDENSELLPSAPRNLRLKNVGVTGARVEWDPPKENVETVLTYEITYQIIDAVDIEMDFAQGLWTVLSGLQDSTMYKVWVKAISAKGESLPSSAAVFMTYAPGGDIMWQKTTVVPPTPPTPVDLEQCCVNEGVTETCQTLCDYDTDFGFLEIGLALSCPSDVGKMLKCASDGRNHTSCCQRRNLDQDCLPLCAFDDAMLDNFNINDHITCALKLPSILQCFKEGLKNIPGIPHDVAAVNWTTNTIALDWVAPPVIQVPLEGYKVNYLEVENRQELKTVNTKPEMTHVIVPNLKPDTAYELWVVAFNREGESLASETLTVWTLEDESTLPDLNFSMPTNFTECCKGYGVAGECMPACDGSGVVKMDTCSSDIGKLITCAADGEDHKACCRRSRVPESCLHFCEGKPAATSWTELLCLSYTELMLSCFREKNAQLPSPPQRLRKTDGNATSVTLAWEPPQRHPERVYYIVYYKPTDLVDDAPFQSERTKATRYTISGLKAPSYYHVYIQAFNSYGASKPSAMLKVSVDDRVAPKSKVWATPRTVIEEGRPVSLFCSSDGQPTPKTYWLKDDSTTPLNQAASDFNTFRFKSANKDNTGLYTCVADNGVEPSSTSQLELWVQYAPEVKVPDPRVQVEAGKGHTARLTCNFKGYPDTIEWKKDGKVVPPENSTRDRKRFSRYTQKRIKTRDLVGKLMIALLKDSDYGVYTCAGTNSRGAAIGTVQLTGIGPSTTMPSFTPAPKVDNVTVCCQQKEVRQECMKACSWNVDLSLLDRPELCVADLPKLVRCAADGKDHTKCCADKLVPAACWPYCAGAIEDIEDIQDDHLICLGNLSVIVNCMESGRDNIPSAPVGLNGKEVNGYLELNWKPPLENLDRLSKYVVYYREGIINGGEKTKEVDKTALTTYIKGVYSYTNYTITVRAVNRYGISPASNAIWIFTDELVPSAPTDLEAKLVDGIYVRLTWGKPINHAGAVLSYNIHYGQANSKFDQHASVNHTRLTYRVENLEPHTKYSFYVEAGSSHHLSEKSETINLKTEKYRSTNPAKQSSGDDSDVGIGIGVGLLFLVAIVVIVALAFYFFRIRRRENRTRFDDSVAFQNPGYAVAHDPRVSGLPGDRTPSGEMGDSSIMQEAGENGHKVYLKSPHLHGNEAEEDVEPPYATLPVDMTQANVSTDKININFDEPITGNNKPGEL